MKCFNKSYYLEICNVIYLVGRVFVLTDCFSSFQSKSAKNGISSEKRKWNISNERKMP